MNRTAGVIKMHLRDKWTWFYVPWLILMISFVVNLIIGILTGGVETLNSGGIASIYCYMFVAMLIVLGQTFPFALGMSIRRTDFFIGTTVMGLLVCLFSSLILFLFSVVEKLTDGWGVNLLYFNPFFINGMTSFGRIGLYFIGMLYMFFLGFFISSIHRRFGKTGLWAFFIAIFIVSSFGSFALTYYSRWMDLFSWISLHYMNLFIWMIPCVIVYALLSYGMLRRATVS